MSESKYKVNGNEYTVSVGDTVEGKVAVQVNGVLYNVELEEQPQAPAPRPAVVATPKKDAAAAPKAASKKSEKSPLPGVIIAVNVKVGDQVKKGDTVVVLEAMKMENNIPAAVSGTIASVCVTTGDTVLEGTDLITYE